METLNINSTGIIFCLVEILPLTTNVALFDSTAYKKKIEINSYF